MQFHFGLGHWVTLLMVAAVFYFVGSRNPNLPIIGIGGMAAGS